MMRMRNSYNDKKKWNIGCIYISNPATRGSTNVAVIEGHQ